MQHGTPLISTIVAGLVLAFIFGMIANRFKMPPLVGYLVAGMLVGPYTPGFVADGALANELSEIGVILLMFGVGLHFSLKDLLSVQAVAVPGALLRIAGGTALGLGLALVMGWSVGAGLIFGLALSVASTVVLLQALQDRHLIDSDRGRIAVGWVIVEDVAMVLALVLIPAMAGLLGGVIPPESDPFVSFVERTLRTDIGIGGVLAVTVIKLAAFVGFMLIVGRRVIPALLHFTAHTGSRELFRLAVLAIALGVAAGAAYLFGVSLALGAFFAGMILSESELSHRAAQESLPLRDAFAVLFFVSVGMLFDPAILIANPFAMAGTLFIVLLGKSILAFFLVLALRRPASSALTISASLAQIGEFSFILAALGVSYGIMPEEGRSLILAGSIISIILNPVMFWSAERLRPWAEHKFGGVEAKAKGATPRVEPEIAAGAAPAADVEEPKEAEEVRHRTALSDHTVLIGFGRVGSAIAEGLKAAGEPFVLVEDAEDRTKAAKAQNIEVIDGNAASSAVLALANVAGARQVMIAIPNAFEAGQATEQARKLNPGVRIVVRAHSDEEDTHLRHLGADTVIMGEREIGMGMLSRLRDDASEPEAPIAPTEPKLAPVDNILEKMAATAVVAVAEPVAAAVEATAPAEPVTADPVAEDQVEVIGAAEVAPDTVIELPPPEETFSIADVAVIEAIESPAASIGPDAALNIEPEKVEAAATLETVRSTPTVAEAPDEIAETAPLVDEVIILPPPAADVPSSGATAEPEIVPATQAEDPADLDDAMPVSPIELLPEEEVAAEDEISEGGPVEPEEVTDAERVAPLVVPEPKI